MTNPTCPALTRGLIAACRCCRWTGGGPGEKCLEKLAEWQERKAGRRGGMMTKTIKQTSKLLYNASLAELTLELERLWGLGHEISAITPVKDFSYPEMDGVSRTDYLIIYKKQA